MTHTAQTEHSGLSLACWIGQLLDKKGGRDIQVIDLHERSTITDFLVITTGTSLKHMETLVDAPCMELKKLGFPASNVEGKSTHWVIADFGDVIVHVFDDEARKYFDLESLWQEAPHIDWHKKKTLASG